MTQLGRALVDAGPLLRSPDTCDRSKWTRYCGAWVDLTLEDRPVSRCLSTGSQTRLPRYRRGRMAFGRSQALARSAFRKTEAAVAWMARLRKGDKPGWLP